MIFAILFLFNSLCLKYIKFDHYYSCDEIIENNIPSNIFAHLSDDMNNITLLFRPKSAGFANRLRALKGFILASLLYNYRLGIDWDDYFYISSPYLKKYEYKNDSCIEISNMFPIISNSLIPGNCYAVNYIFDISSLLMTKSNSIIMTRIFKGNYSLSFIHRKILQEMFILRADLIHSLRTYSEILQHNSIGLQVRCGNGTANFLDAAKYLTINDYDGIMQCVMKATDNRKMKKVQIFLSTDSSIMQNTLQNNSKYPVIVLRDNNIGHTDHRIGNHTSILERAVSDLYLLSQCKVILYTRGSSFGRMALLLSHTPYYYRLRQNRTLWNEETIVDDKLRRELSMNNWTYLGDNPFTNYE